MLTFWEFLNQLYNLTIFPVFTCYLMMCVLAPVWQRYTKPVNNLKYVIIIYDCVCSLLNFYALTGMVYGILALPTIYTNTTSALLIPYYKVYAFTKILELMDTVFMVVKHKSKQISLLHVFHHSTMLILIHYALQYSPWTALAPPLALNSLIHVLLYCYYGYTAYYGLASPYIKRKLTECQITQFLIDLIYAAKGYLYHNFCIWSICYGISMLGFFSNFYYHAYIRVKPNNQVNGVPLHSNGTTVSSKLKSG